MSKPAAILVEAQIEARAVDADAVAELRPVPVWCPLPRGEDDPKVTCVGWLAGRQTARAEGSVTTSTWCQIETAPPRELVSRPADALRLECLPHGAGRLLVLSRARSFEWLRETLARSRRFRASLDLGAVNERRAALSAGVRWTGPLRSRPVFGRGWWLPGEPREPDEETFGPLGALDDRFVLLDASAGSGEVGALVERVEQAVARYWHAEGRAK